jgi:hypothetical protein
VTLTNGNNNIFIGNQGVGDESQTIHRHALLPDPWISDGLCPVARERAAAAFPPAPGHRAVPDELPGADLRVDGAARTEGSHQLAPAQGRAHRGAAPAALQRHRSPRGHGARAAAAHDPAALQRHGQHRPRTAAGSPSAGRRASQNVPPRIPAVEPARRAERLCARVSDRARLLHHPRHAGRPAGP